MSIKSMGPLDQVKLHSLMNISTGISEIVIGIIDGPVDFKHPALQGSRIRTINDSQLAACKNANSIACIHGTFVTGILSAKRGVSAPSICPDCEIILRPIFNENASHNNNDNTLTTLPASTPEKLSSAIIETIDAGARIINLSAGLVSPSLVSYHKLQEAYDYALQKDVMIVVAAGNQGNIGNISLVEHEWVIPVVACNENGRFDPMSNFGPSIGRRGLMAPGVNISSTSPGGEYTHMSGTSFAAPFVTGVIALLWSIFPKTTTTQMIYSIGKGASFNRRSIIPPLLNAEMALEVLKNIKS